MRQHAGFVALIGAAPIAVGGIVMGVGSTEAAKASGAKVDLFANGWFKAGVVILVIGVLIELGAAGLYLFGRPATPVPGVAGPNLIVPDQTDAVGTPPRTSGRPVLGLTADELVAPFNTHTKIQAEGMTAQYKGKWFHAEGEVSDIWSSGTTSVMVTFQSQPQHTRVFMFFAKEHEERLFLLRKGDHIAVEGRIQSLGQHDVTLEDCELV